MRTLNKALAIALATAGGLVAASALAAEQTAAPATTPAPAAATTKQATTTAPAKPHAMLSRKRVEQIQTALANSGEQVQIDGLWGPKTTAALKDFQKSHGLKATGHLDHATGQALKV